MRFLKYLRKYKILCICLAMIMLATSVCDFLSPYITSDIVNIGIQQRGIEYGIPYAMDEQTKHEIDSLILTPDESQYLNDAYTSNDNLYRLKDKDVNKQQLSKTTEPILAYLDSCQNTNTKPAISDFATYLENTDNASIHSTSINYTIKLNKQFNVDQINICLDYLFTQGAILLAVFFASIFLCIISGINSSVLVLKIGKDMRQKVYKAILTLTSKQIDYFTRSSLTTRSTTDIQVVQNMCLLIINLFVCVPLGGVVGIVFAIKTAPSLLWIILLGILLIIIAATIVYVWAKPKFIVLQTILDKVASNTRRLVNGSLVYRAFNRQELEFDNFDKDNQDLYKRRKFIYKSLAIINPLLGLGYGGMALLIIYFGSLDVQRGLIQTGQIIAFISYANMIVASVVSVGMLIGSLPATTVCADRIDEIIQVAKSNNQYEVKGSTNKKQKKCHINNFDITFKDVSFKYDKSSSVIIKKVNFNIKHGSNVAVIGVTGSGKSTLCKLMLKLYDCDSGLINIANCNISKLSTYQVRDMFSFAGQDSFLFSDSIKNNVLYGTKNYSVKNLNASINHACLSKMIESQPQGLDFQIQQNAKNISGGQKQRISIARALAKDSQIYIFDDCFSSLDYQTENKLFTNIQKSIKSKTKIFVTQKINIAKHADQILVLDDGQLVGNGNHEYLIKNCAEYIEICNSQNEKT